MSETVAQLMFTGAAILLGVMNFMKHRHLEQDMKRYPLVLTIEIGYDDELKPKATVKEVSRAR